MAVHRTGVDPGTSGVTSSTRYCHTTIHQATHTSTLINCNITISQNVHLATLTGWCDDKSNF